MFFYLSQHVRGLCVRLPAWEGRACAHVCILPECFVVSLRVYVMHCVMHTHIRAHKPAWSTW